MRFPLSQSAQGVGGGCHLIMGADMDLHYISPGLGLEFARGSRRDNLPMVDNHDLMGELIRLVEILRGQQHISSLNHQGADRIPQFDAAPRITEIVLTHEGLTTEAQRALAGGGWPSLFDALASVLSSPHLDL